MNGSAQHADLVAAMAKQNADHLAAIAEQAQASKDERDVLFDHVYTISRKLAALNAAPIVGNDNGGSDGSGDGSSGAAGGSRQSEWSEYSEIFLHDTTGALTLRGPQIVFESDKCAATDLCELQRQVQALMRKFNGTGPA